MDFTKSLSEHIRAGYQIISVVTKEEKETDLAIVAAAEDVQSRWLARIQKTAHDWPGHEKEFLLPVMAWDSVSGLVELNDPPAAFQHVIKGYEVPNPPRALADVLKRFVGQFITEVNNSVLVIKDFHNHQDLVEVRRTIRALYAENAFGAGGRQRTLILMQPYRKLALDLVDCVVEIPFQMPSREELEKIVVTAYRENKGAKAPLDASLNYSLSRDLQGLTHAEAMNCTFLGVIRNGFNEKLSPVLQEIKSGIFSRDGILRYTSPDQIPNADEIGGYGSWMEFVDTRALAYTREAEAVKLDLPKGAAVFGIPGTGKSMAGAIAAKRLNLPLVVFDFSAVFGSLVGESERQMREVIEKVTAINGCVLLVDEADKAIGNSADASGDSGATRRVFGSFLSWLAIKNDRTFPIFTLNRIDRLPPELLRRGRVDQLFYVDIPTPSERKSILGIHLKKRGIDPSRYEQADWDSFLDKSEDYVGAELEEAVKSARFEAFQNAYVRRRIDASKGASVEDKARILGEVKQFGDRVKLAASDLMPEELELASAAIPTAKQLLDALVALEASKVAKINQASIDAIRQFGRENGKPVGFPEAAAPAAGGRRRRNMT